MKKARKNIFIAILFLCAVVLIIINRHSTQAQIDMAAEHQLAFVINGQEKVYGYDDTSADYTTFDTQMKRKNGDVFDKNYSGIPMATILEDMGIDITDSVDIRVVCADNYEIQLTASEILAEGNIYLITKENGEKLAESDGPFMLVINNDEFSTRWAKNVVQVKVN